MLTGNEKSCDATCQNVSSRQLRGHYYQDWWKGFLWRLSTVLDTRACWADRNKHHNHVVVYLQGQFWCIILEWALWSLAAGLWHFGLVVLEMAHDACIIYIETTHITNSNHFYHANSFIFTKSSLATLLLLIEALTFYDLLNALD